MPVALSIGTFFADYAQRRILNEKFNPMKNP
jgi:hypothetical protein